jgi:hypothetical protein
MRKAFYCKSSNISVLELEAVPQIWIPKVQIGLIIAL